jgi:adenylate kinase family enzyme
MLDCAKILNDTSKTDTELGKKVKEAIVAGLAAVPDELVTEAVVSRLAMPDCMSEGWILSGCPRTPAQAEAILNYAVRPDAYIMLEVDEAVASERLKSAGKVL